MEFDTEHILSFEEQQEVYDLVERFDQAITDEIYDKAASYEIEEDEDTYITTVKIYDEDENVLLAMEVPDYDEALEILDDLFEIEDEELEIEEEDEDDE